MRRTIIAFVVAPLMVPLVFFLTAVGLKHLSLDAASVSVIALPFAYIAEIIFGLPTWLVFRHYRISSFPAYAVGGGLIGFVVALIILWDSSPPTWIRDGGPDCVLAGLLSSVVFRRISD